jgi:hypothetical protein
MGIYSANRMSSVRTGSMRPDMSYAGTAGIGRCMYESTVNDCILGESLLMQDFNEVRAMREGTVLESEMRVMQENVVTDFFKKCKELLIKLGKKIAGIFRQVYAKLTQWFVRSGKMYVKMHRKTVLSKDIRNLEIKKYRKPKNFKADTKVKEISDQFNNLIKDVKNKNKTDMKIAVNFNNYRDSSVSTKETSEYKYELLGINEDDDYYEHLMNAAYEDEDTVSASNISLTKTLDNVEKGSETIRNLKKLEKTFKENIKKAQSAITTLEGKVNKMEESDSNKKSNTDYITQIRSSVSAFQQAMNTATSAAIRVVKFSIKQDRSVIAQIVAYTPKAENGLLMREAAEDAADEVDEILDSPAEEDVAEGMPEFEDVDTDDSGDDDDED